MIFQVMLFYPKVPHPTKAKAGSGNPKEDKQEKMMRLTEREEKPNGKTKHENKQNIKNLVKAEIILENGDKTKRWN